MVLTVSLVSLVATLYNLYQASMTTIWVSIPLYLGSLFFALIGFNLYRFKQGVVSNLALVWLYIARTSNLAG